MGAVYDRTKNFLFNLINFDYSSWHNEEYNNWRILDAILANYISLLNVQGVWINSTAYTVSQVLVDKEEATLWECQLNHTSAVTPTTFEEDRLTTPGRWSAIGAEAFAAKASKYSEDSKVFAGVALAARNQADNSVDEIETKIKVFNKFKDTCLLAISQSQNYMLQCASYVEDAELYRNASSHGMMIVHTLTNRVRSLYNKAIEYNLDTASKVSITTYYSEQTRKLYNKIVKYVTITENLVNQANGTSLQSISTINTLKYMMKRIEEILIDITTKSLLATGSVQIIQSLTKQIRSLNSKAQEYNFDTSTKASVATYYSEQVKKLYNKIVIYVNTTESLVNQSNNVSSQALAANNNVKRLQRQIEGTIDDVITKTSMANASIAITNQNVQLAKKAVASATDDLQIVLLSQVYGD